MADWSSEQRTEAPTPRRIQQARRAGQTAVSRDLGSAVVMSAACLALIATAQAGVAELVLAMREALTGATRSVAIASAVRAGLDSTLITLAPLLGGFMVTACLITLLQTRGLATFAPARPDARRVLPSFDRVLGRDRAMEVGKGVLALVLLLAVACWSIGPVLSGIATLGGASAARILYAVGVLGVRLGTHLAAAVMVFGAIDYLCQRWRHRKALRMSRDEVKRERKEAEGDPAHKAERLRRYRGFMHAWVLDDVRRADLVVVQDGVMAAAIVHDPDGANAPVVMVKGEHRRAQTIEDFARASGVPVFADVDLVRALMSVAEGAEIPEVLFERVAELLVSSESLRPPVAMATRARCAGEDLPGAS